MLALHWVQVIVPALFNFQAHKAVSMTLTHGIPIILNANEAFSRFFKAAGKDYFESMKVVAHLELSALTNRAGWRQNAQTVTSFVAEKHFMLFH